MLENCARWIAEEAAKFGIPINEAFTIAGAGPSRGVCQHDDLGSWGGGHWDCGSGFPIDEVLEMARTGSGAGGEEYMNPPTMAVGFRSTGI